MLASFVLGHFEMTLSDYASVATVISGFAVVVSLIYLAQQTRQATRHTRALIEQERNKQIIENQMLFVTDQSVRDLSLRGDAADPNLTEDEVRRYFRLVSSQLLMFEDLFYQHRAGLIDKERHASTVMALKTTRLNKFGFRAAWQSCKPGMGLEFQAFIESLMKTVEPQRQRDLTTVWRTLIKAEQPGEAAAAEQATGEQA